MIGLLGATQAARLAKVGPSIVAMAKGETTNPMLANFVRCIGVVLAVGAVIANYGITGVAICGLVGETLAAVAAVLLLRVRLQVSVRSMILSLIGHASVVAACFLIASIWLTQGFSLAGISLGSGVAVILIVPLVKSFKKKYAKLDSISKAAKVDREKSPKAALP